MIALTVVETYSYTKLMHTILSLYKGRMNRGMFILAYGGVLFVGVVLTLANEYRYDLGVEYLRFVYLLLALALVYVAYGLIVKRLHDIGNSGWLSLAGLIPVVNCALLIYLVVKAGSKKKNRYGPVPR